MRTLSGLILLILAALGGAYMAWPEQLKAGWANAVSRAEEQIQIELATVEQIRTGKMKLGVETRMADRPSPVLIISAEPKSDQAGKQVRAEQKSDSRRAPRPSSTGKAETTVSSAKAAQPAAIPAAAITSPAAAITAPVTPEKGAPETALGAILKHEIRENQAKEDTFWTHERIQEALKHGPPSNSNSACLAFCDKNDAPVEINMPKTPAGSP